MALELPFPPPAGGQGGAYRTWRQLALWQLAQQLDSLEAGHADSRPVTLDIRLARPPTPEWRLSELAPALEDVLVAGGLIPDRNLIEAVQLRWANADPNARRLAVLATKDVRRHLVRLSEEGGQRGAPS